MHNPKLKSQTPITAEDFENLFEALCNASEILESKIKSKELLKAQQLILEVLMIVNKERKKKEREQYIR